jgi:hypothetical protein
MDISYITFLDGTMDIYQTGYILDYFPNIDKPRGDISLIGHIIDWPYSTVDHMFRLDKP